MVGGWPLPKHPDRVCAKALVALDSARGSGVVHARLASQAPGYGATRGERRVDRVLPRRVGRNCLVLSDVGAAGDFPDVRWWNVQHDAMRFSCS